MIAMSFMNNICSLFQGISIMFQEEQALLILLPMVKLTLLAMVSWTLCTETMDSMGQQEDLLILPIKSCRWNYTTSIRYTQIMKWLRKGKLWDSMNANTMVSCVYQFLIPFSNLQWLSHSCELQTRALNTPRI